MATLGDLLFGYDTAVISGAIGSPGPTLILTLHNQAGQGRLCHRRSHGRWVADRFERKLGLLLAALLFTISAVGSAIPESFTEFVIYRIVGGVGVDIASMLSPMYIDGIAPAHLRGRLVSLNQFAIIFGMLIVTL